MLFVFYRLYLLAACIVCDIIGRIYYAKREYFLMLNSVYINCDIIGIIWLILIIRDIITQQIMYIQEAKISIDLAFE